MYSPSGLVQPSPFAEMYWMYKEMQGSVVCKDVQGLEERQQEDPLSYGQWEDLPLMHSSSGLVNSSPFAKMCWMYKEMQGSVVCKDVQGLGERRQEDPLPYGQWEDLPLMYSPSGLVDPSPLQRCVGYAKIYIDVSHVQKCRFFFACLSADMQ